MARNLILAAEASEAGNSYKSGAPDPCRCDIRGISAGHHVAGCSKL